MNPDLLEVVWTLIAADQQEGDFDASALLRLRHRRGYPTLIPYSHSDADFLVDLLSEAELRHLIRALVRFSVVTGPGRSGGSVSPMSPLYYRYAARYPDREPELTSWVVENRINSYDPFGTTSFSDAASLEEHKRLRRERQQFVAAENERRLAASRKRRAQIATERLPNAVRRGDIKAVQALLARGAEPENAVQGKNGLQDLAHEHGRTAMLDFLKESGIE